MSLLDEDRTASAEPVAIELADPAAEAGDPSRCTVEATFLVRHGGLPATATAHLVLSRTAAVLDEAAATAHEAARMAGHIEDSLYRIVPETAQDRALRRDVLAVRRDLHNARTPRLSADRFAAVVGTLGEDEGRDLDTWGSLVNRRDTAVATAEAGMAAELEEVEASLLACLDEPRIRAALALARPTLATKLLARSPRSDRPSPESRFGRDCASALLRAAVKTSPFSWLTTLGLGSFDPDSAIPAGKGTGPDATDARRRTAATHGPEALLLENPALALALLKACSSRVDVAGAFEYEVNASCRLGADPLALLPTYHQTDGFLFREEELVGLGVVAGRLAHLPIGGRLGFADLVEALGDVTVALRLIRLELVRAIAPWERRERAPLGRLLAALEDALEAGVISATAQDIVDATRRLATAVEVQRDGAASQRIEASVCGATELGRLTGLLQRPYPWGVEPVALCYEEVAESVPDASHLPASVAGDLRRLAAMIASKTCRSGFYELLVQEFVTRYGVSGRTDDILGFLGVFARRDDLPFVVSRSTVRDRWPDRCDDRNPFGALCGASTFRPGVSLLFQIAASSRTALQRGDYLVVANLYGGLTGAIAARFSSFETTGPQWRDAVAGFVERQAGAARVLEVPVAADWSSLQRGLGAFPVLRWPSEAPFASKDEEVGIDQLSIVHDPETNSLHVVGPGSVPFGFGYFGTVPHYLLGGPVRLLLTLSDPWVVHHRIGWSTRPFDPPLGMPAGVEHSPREVTGRIVLRRARWRMPVTEFPVRATGESSASLLRRALAWRNALGMPAEVFVSVELAPGSRKGLSKPTWVHFASLHALALAGELAAGAKVLQVVEALPSSTQHAVCDPAGDARAVEYLALLDLSGGDRA